jgi:hypothetical protein
MQLRKLLSCLLIGVVLSGVVLASIPYAIVKNHPTSTISGTVRCGGGCDTVGILQGEPIDVAGSIFAFMTMALDPYTGQPRPDLLIKHAQTSFDASAYGRYELQGVEPGIFDLWVSATGFPRILFASGVTVYADQNLSIDAYVCSSSATFVNGICQSPYYQQPSTSATQVGLTPYTPHKHFSTPSAITSTPSLQMPQLPQPTAIQSTNNNTPQLGLTIELIVAVVLGAVFLYSGRKEQPKVKKAKKVDSKTEKVASGKNFCIECGQELSLGSKFCNNCGSKQP